MEYRQILFDTQEIRESFVEETMTILAFTGIGTPPSWPDEPIQQGACFPAYDLLLRLTVYRIVKTPLQPIRQSRPHTSSGEADDMY